MNNEVKILCRFCKLKDSCTHQQRKRKYEDAGWMTYCSTAKPVQKNREQIARAEKFRETGRRNAKRRPSKFNQKGAK